MRYLLTFLVIVVLTCLPLIAEVTTQDKTDFALSIFIPCAAGGAGEMVNLNGTLHSVVSATVNGNNVTGYFHFQPQDVTGTGQTTGAKYQATGVTQQSFKTSLQNGQGQLTFVNNFRIIGQGPGNNFVIHETMHITFNADGTMTVNHDNFTSDCK
jgi:hypothetical protein